MIDKTKNIETSIEDENIFTYLELPSRMLLYMNSKPAMGKFHLFIECIVLRICQYQEICDNCK